MKKTIKILTFVLTFFVMSKNCYAIDIKQEKEITNMKVYTKINNKEEIRNIYQIINENTDELVYNIEFDNKDYTNIYDSYDYYGGVNPLSKDLKDKIALIIYYGYGYNNRKDIKWYGITQYLIWETIIKESGNDITLLDSNGNMNTYQEEINAILDDIKESQTIPSFLEKDSLQDTYNLKLTDELFLIDKNNNLDKFNIINDTSDLELEIKNNTIHIKPKYPNVINIIFQRKMENLSKNIEIYTNSNNQRLVTRGNIDIPSLVMTINIKQPVIKLNDNNIEKNKFSLEGSTYNIYFENGQEYYQNIIFNKNEESNIYEIYPGKYYLQQIKPSYGYKLNNEKIYFEVDKEDIILNIKSELETKNITIEKQIINDKNEVESKANAKLIIYDDKGNLIKELKTNSKGKATIELSYGTYSIFESNNLKNRASLTFVVDEKFNEEEPIVILEEQEADNDFNENINVNKGSITFNKYDAITGKPLSGIKIALYNKDKELIEEAQTDPTGKVIFKDIETGTYYIKEILKDGDNNLKDAIKVEVKENIDTIITSNDRTKIDVPDTYKTNLSWIFYSIFIGTGLLINKRITNEKAKDI